jgi:hypothetical protein
MTKKLITIQDAAFRLNVSEAVVKALSQQMFDEYKAPDGTTYYNEDEIFDKKSKFEKLYLFWRASRVQK